MKLNTYRKIIFWVGALAFFTRWSYLRFSSYSFPFSNLLVDWLVLIVGVVLFFIQEPKKRIIILYLFLIAFFLLISFAPASFSRFTRWSEATERLFCCFRPTFFVFFLFQTNRFNQSFLPEIVKTKELRN